MRVILVSLLFLLVSYSLAFASPNSKKIEKTVTIRIPADSPLLRGSPSVVKKRLERIGEKNFQRARHEAKVECGEYAGELNDEFPMLLCTSAPRGEFGSSSDPEEDPVTGDVIIENMWQLNCIVDCQIKDLDELCEFDDEFCFHGDVDNESPE